MTTLWDNKRREAYERLCGVASANSAEFEGLTYALHWILRDRRDGVSPRIERWRIVQTDHRVDCKWIEWWTSLYDQLKLEQESLGDSLIDWLHYEAPMPAGQNQIENIRAS